MADNHFIGDAQEQVALDKLGAWLERGDLARICVHRITRAGKQNLIRGSELYRETLDSFPEPRERAVLDQILGAHGDVGGTIQLCAEFAPQEEGGSPPSPQRHRVGLTRSRPGGRTGSKGGDAAAEALSASMSAMTDQLRRSHDELSGRFVDALQDQTKAQGESFEQRLSMHHSYQGHILELQLRVSELTFQLQMQEALSAQGNNNHFVELAKELIPIAGDAMQGVVAAWRSETAALEGGAPPENGSGDGHAAS